MDTHTQARTPRDVNTDVTALSSISRLGGHPAVPSRDSVSGDYTHQHAAPAGFAGDGQDETINDNH